MDSSLFVSIVKGSDGNVFVIVRQTTADGRTNEIILNNVHFSGLMYMFKSIEQQFVADESRKRIYERCSYDRFPEFVRPLQARHVADTVRYLQARHADYTMRCERRRDEAGSEKKGEQTE